MNQPPDPYRVAAELALTHARRFHLRACVGIAFMASSHGPEKVIGGNLAHLEPEGVFRIGRGFWLAGARPDEDPPKIMLFPAGRATLGYRLDVLIRVNTGWAPWSEQGLRWLLQFYQRGERSSGNAPSFTVDEEGQVR